ncbi:hypothetical protein C8R46DRAFT_292246 [Mycena filopes]|nr:hypothetical protein C8R46DRAFT_292246 [Mycena filopes]
MNSFLDNTWTLVSKLPKHVVQYGTSFLQSRGVHTQNLTFATLFNPNYFAAQVGVSALFIRYPRASPPFIASALCWQYDRRVELEDSLAIIVSLDSFGLRSFFPVDPSTSATRDALCAEDLHPEPPVFVDMSTNWTPIAIAADPDYAVLSTVPATVSSNAGHNEEGEGDVKNDWVSEEKEGVYAQTVNIEDDGEKEKDSDAQTQTQDRPIHTTIHL